MKWVLGFCAALFLGFPAYALDSCLTGSWFGDAKHEGINIEVNGDQVLVYWYTYRFFDRAEQNWLVFVGTADNLVAYDVIPFGDDPREFEVGTATLEVIDQNTVRFSYDFQYELDQLEVVDECAVLDPDVNTPWCLDERCTGTFEYKRLTQPISCL